MKTKFPVYLSWSAATNSYYFHDSTSPTFLTDEITVVYVCRTPRSLRSMAAGEVTLMPRGFVDLAIGALINLD